MSAQASEEPSVVARFFEGLKALGESDFQLVRNQYQRQWEDSKDKVEDARLSALDALGAVNFHDVMEAVSNTPDAPQSPGWWAAGDAAVALASRGNITAENYQVLTRPLAVAMPWSKSAQSDP